MERGVSLIAVGKYWGRRGSCRFVLVSPLALATTLPAASGLAATPSRQSPFVVTLSASRAAGMSLHATRFSGQVTPRAPHMRVVLQTRAAGRWRTAATGFLTRRSTFSLLTRLRGVGGHFFRVLKPAASGHAEGFSSVVVATVPGKRVVHSRGGPLVVSLGAVRVKAPAGAIGRGQTLSLCRRSLRVDGGKSLESQAALFDDVMRQLLEEIEAGARARFAEYLAERPAAPSGILRQLALDDAIEIARPILARAEALDETTLVEGARHKSQAHLLAISTRKAVPQSVTDILLERGDREVALSTAANPGASFSEFGYSSLVRRSSDDDEMAIRTWSRPEIPRRHLLKLFADASEAVRRRLSREDPRRAALIAETVARAASELQTQTREGSAAFAGAVARVQALRDAGRLDEPALLDFAKSENFAETVLVLSIMCDLPVGLVERALVEERSNKFWCSPRRSAWAGGPPRQSWYCRHAPRNRRPSSTASSKRSCGSSRTRPRRRSSSIGCVSGP